MIGWGVAVVASSTPASAAEPGGSVVSETKHPSQGARTLLARDQLLTGAVDEVATRTQGLGHRLEAEKTGEHHGAAGHEHRPQHGRTGGQQDTGEPRRGAADATTQASDKPTERVLHSAVANLPVQASLSRVGEIGGKAAAGAAGAVGDVDQKSRAFARHLALQIHPIATRDNPLGQVVSLPSLADPTASGSAGAQSSADEARRAARSATVNPDDSLAKRSTGNADTASRDRITGAANLAPATADMPGTDPTHDKTPVVPVGHRAPAGSDSTQVGGGSGSVGSHALAEPVEVLAASRPAVPASCADAELTSDDEGRPSVSPD